MKYIFSLLSIIVVASAREMKDSQCLVSFHCDSDSQTTTLCFTNRETKAVQTITKYKNGTMCFSLPRKQSTKCVEFDAEFAHKRQILIQKLTEFEEFIKNN